MSGWLQLKYFSEVKMNEEQMEKTMNEIIDQLGYLLMEMILASFKKINMENYLLQELMEAKMQERNQPEL
jgi:hypothetical protein